MNTKTDMDVEVDAFERQFELEKILGVEADGIRKIFQRMDDHPERASSRHYRKASFLLNEPYNGKRDRYFVRQRMEYEKEFGE